MFRIVVALLAGIGVAASGLVGLTHGYLIGVVLGIAAIAGGLVTYTTVPSRRIFKHLRWPFPNWNHLARYVSGRHPIPSRNPEFEIKQPGLAILPRIVCTDLPPGPDARACVLNNGLTLIVIRKGLTRAKRRAAVHDELERLRIWAPDFAGDAHYNCPDAMTWEAESSGGPSRALLLPPSFSWLPTLRCGRTCPGLQSDREVTRPGLGGLGRGNRAGSLVRTCDSGWLGWPDETLGDGVPVVAS